MRISLNMFPTAVRIRWADAIDTGLYGQAPGYLRSNLDDYCCLGVLADLAVQDLIANWDIAFGPRPVLRKIDEFIVTDTCLPEYVIRHFIPGLDPDPLGIQDVRVFRDRDFPTLSNLNDGTRLLDPLLFEDISLIIRGTDLPDELLPVEWNPRR